MERAGDYRAFRSSVNKTFNLPLMYAGLDYDKSWIIGYDIVRRGSYYVIQRGRLFLSIEFAA